MSVVSFSGLASGIDSATLIDKLVAAEKTQEDQYTSQQATLSSKKTAINALTSSVSSLGYGLRVLIPQRDAIGRLARREFPIISDEMAFRFRDVYDHVVRLTEEVILFQDRMTSVLEVNLASVSNRLNQVMKVLTVMSTIFLPLTVLTSMWGMNIELPHMPGGADAQFWWISGIMFVVSLGMLIVFRLNKWI